MITAKKTVRSNTSLSYSCVIGGKRIACLYVQTLRCLI